MWNYVEFCHFEKPCFNFVDENTIASLVLCVYLFILSFFVRAACTFIALFRLWQKRQIYRKYENMHSLQWKLFWKIGYDAVRQFGYEAGKKYTHTGTTAATKTTTTAQKMYANNEKIARGSTTAIFFSLSHFICKFIDKFE